MPSVSLKTAVERIGSPVSIKMDIEGAEYEALAEIPEGVQEILGELHPEKANRSNYDIKEMLIRRGFVNVTIGTNKKCPFRAVV